LIPGALEGLIDKIDDVLSLVLLFKDSDSNIEDDNGYSSESNDAELQENDTNATDSEDNSDDGDVVFDLQHGKRVLISCEDSDDDESEDDSDDDDIVFSPQYGKRVC